MRFLTVCGAAILALGLAAPAAADDSAMTQGEFAVLLMQAGAGFIGELPDPESALSSAKELEMVPESWTLDAPLTHGEMADVLQSLGITHVPGDPDAPVSRAFAEALLRRELSRLRDYLASRLGHGFSMNHILDMGVDRAVSPSTFD